MMIQELAQLDCVQRHPHYLRGDVLLVNADCRTVLASLPDGCIDAAITDPVWPNAKINLPGYDECDSLLAEMGNLLERRADRIAVQLGCDTDPRFLTSLSCYWPFFKSVWMRYALPHYKGRVLYTADVAYLFGEPPVSRKGYHVIGGECVKTESGGRLTAHPCERSLEHMVWLVTKWSEPNGLIADPFMGSGTTCVASIRHGRACLGVEIHEPYFLAACRRVDEAFDQTALIDPTPPATVSPGLFDELTEAK